MATPSSKFELSSRNQSAELSAAMTDVTCFLEPLITGAQGALTGAIAGLALNILGKGVTDISTTTFLGASMRFSITLCYFYRASSDLKSYRTFDKIASVAFGVITGIAMTALVGYRVAVPAVCATSLMTAGLFICEDNC